MHYDSIAAICERIRTRQVSPVDVLEACLARIEAHGARLNGFITLAPDARAQAVQAASDIAQGRWRGPLHGVPVAVKDFYDTEGLPTTAGSDRLRDRVPGSDAEVVRRLREAGAILVGKTNMDAMGMSTTGLTSSFGAVVNPWSALHVTGGSSAGSACAVAAGLCFATVDTDAVGSVRLPASCCGVVGFKGSYGLVSVQGILGDEPVDDFIRWMGHAGITARSPLDAAHILDALSPRQGLAYAASVAAAIQPLCIGVVHPPTADTDVDVAQAFGRAVERLEHAGHTVRDATLPEGSGAMGDMTRIEQDRASIDAWFGDIDLFVLPTLVHRVPTVAQASADPDHAVSADYTAFANYFGLPAISIPCGADRDGLPIGLQIVGRPGRDDQVLAASQHHVLNARAALGHPLP
ncbi:MAG: amidase [Proteobacteria bacterium]|nr:amidase [Pseudomonadota bacterium]